MEAAGAMEERGTRELGSSSPWRCGAGCVKTAGTGAAEVTGTGKSGALAVVAIRAVVAIGSGQVGVGGGEDMIAPKLSDTKLVGTGSLPGRGLRL